MAGTQSQQSEPLLSQTVLAKQVLNGRQATQTVTLPPGCSSGTFSCPNMDQAALTDPTKLLQIDVEFSMDGVNWEHHVGAGLWQGNASGTAPGGFSTWIDPQFAGAQVRAWLDDKGTGVSTDGLVQIF